jgi:hypothetical protein
MTQDELKDHLILWPKGSAGCLTKSSEANIKSLTGRKTLAGEIQRANAAVSAQAEKSNGMWRE